MGRNGRLMPGALTRVGEVTQNPIRRDLNDVSENDLPNAFDDDSGFGRHRLGRANAALD